MPITKSAKRALKKSSQKRKTNLQNKVILKKTKKDFLRLLEEKQTEKAKKMLPRAYKLLDKAAKSYLIKKNKASREKSRLARKLVNKK